MARAALRTTKSDSNHNQMTNQYAHASVLRWSQAEKRAWESGPEFPDVFLHDLTLPTALRRTGKWTESECEAYRARSREYAAHGLFGRCWGLFSVKLDGRTGKDCAVAAVHILREELAELRKVSRSVPSADTEAFLRQENLRAAEIFSRREVTNAIYVVSKWYAAQRCSQGSALGGVLPSCPEAHCSSPPVRTEPDERREPSPPAGVCRSLAPVALQCKDTNGITARGKDLFATDMSPLPPCDGLPAPCGRAHVAQIRRESSLSGRTEEMDNHASKRHVETSDGVIQTGNVEDVAETPRKRGRLGLHRRHRVLVSPVPAPHIGKSGRMAACRETVVPYGAHDDKKHHTVDVTNVVLCQRGVEKGSLGSPDGRWRSSKRQNEQAQDFDLGSHTPGRSGKKSGAATAAPLQVLSPDDGDDFVPGTLSHAKRENGSRCIPEEVDAITFVAETRAPPLPLPRTWAMTCTPGGRGSTVDTGADLPSRVITHDLLHGVNFSNICHEALAIVAAPPDGTATTWLRACRIPEDALRNGFLLLWVEKGELAAAVREAREQRFTLVESICWVRFRADNTLSLEDNRVFQSARRLLLLFRRGATRSIDLRHQRSPDVIYDFVQSDTYRPFEDVALTVEALLPEWLVAAAEGVCKLVELWAAPNAARRRGWIRVSHGPASHEDRLPAR